MQPKQQQYKENAQAKMPVCPKTLVGRKRPEVTDNLHFGVCILNPLLEVSIVPSLVKVET